MEEEHAILSFHLRGLSAEAQGLLEVLLSDWLSQLYASLESCLYGLANSRPEDNVQSICLYVLDLVLIFLMIILYSLSSTTQIQH